MVLGCGRQVMSYQSAYSSLSRSKYIILGHLVEGPEPEPHGRRRAIRHEPLFEILSGTTVNADTSCNPTGGFKLGSNGGLLNAAGNRALAGIDRASAFASFSAVRPSIPTGTGLPRAAQFGLRIRF